MSCPGGRKKKRHAGGRGHPSPYARSMRGHSWKRLIVEDVGNCGRICKNCGKKILNMRGLVYEREKVL